MKQSKKSQVFVASAITGAILSSGIIFASVRANENGSSQLEVSSQIAESNFAASEALYQLYTIGIPSNIQTSQSEGNFIRPIPTDLWFHEEESQLDSQEIQIRKALAQTAFENTFSHGSSTLKTMFQSAINNTFELVENPNERLLDGGISRLKITNSEISGSSAVVSMNATLWSRLISLDSNQVWNQSIPTDDAQIKVILVLGENGSWKVVDLVVSPNSI